MDLTPSTEQTFAHSKSASWSPEKSAAIYGINNWGAGYFRVNSNGNVSITPKAKKARQLICMN